MSDEKENNFMSSEFIYKKTGYIKNPSNEQFEILNKIGKVLGYNVTYSKLNLHLFKNENQLYMSRIIIKIMEEVDKMYVPKKITYPTKKGTQIQYVLVESETCKNAKYLKVTNDFIDEYNNKYNANVTKLGIFAQPPEKVHYNLSYIFRKELLTKNKIIRYIM